MWIKFDGLFIGLIAPGFTQSIGKKGEQKAWNTGEEESESPLAIAKSRDNAASDKSDHQTDERTSRPAAHYLCSLRTTKIVTEQGGASGIVASFTNAQDHT